MADQKTQRSTQARQPQRNSAAGATGGDAQNAGNVSNIDTASTASNAGSAASRTDQHTDREREREVSREGNRATGTGMQRGGAQQGGRGSALLGGQQGRQSLLPALLSNPDLMTRAFMANPFSFAQAMSQEMDRLFSTGGADSLSSPVGQTGGRGQTGRGLSQWTPPMEVVQRENELVVRADLPGLKPEDIQIDVEDHVLTISGERQEQSEDRQNGFYRTERSYGSFTRSIALPDGIDEEQVNACFEHGVLEVTVPLPQQRQRGRRIQVKSGTTSGAAAVTGQQSQGAAQGANHGGNEGARPGGRSSISDATVAETQGSE
jgi:HSP20 family protein